MANQWSPDRELGNADWTKQSWDLPTDRDEFLHAISPDPERHATDAELSAFMKLPAARAIPDALKKDIL